MGATITFQGVALASTNPQFVDHCTILANPTRWKDVGPVTVHIFPTEDFSSLYATFAWRNEPFAYARSMSENMIMLGKANEKEVVSPCKCSDTNNEAIRHLATLLHKYMEEQIAIRKKWLELTEDMHGILGTHLATNKFPE